MLAFLKASQLNLSEKAEQAIFSSVAKLFYRLYTRRRDILVTMTVFFVGEQCVSRLAQVRYVGIEPAIPRTKSSETVAIRPSSHLATYTAVLDSLSVQSGVTTQ